ncbi:hypothetical protein P9112_003005 [Eukaryota sp. TZLM1-RC]
MGNNQSQLFSPYRNVLSALTSPQSLPADFLSPLLNINHLPLSDLSLVVRPYVPLIPRSPHIDHLFSSTISILNDESPQHPHLKPLTFLSTIFAKVLSSQSSPHHLIPSLLSASLKYLISYLSSSPDTPLDQSVPFLLLVCSLSYPFLSEDGSTGVVELVHEFLCKVLIHFQDYDLVIESSKLIFMNKDIDSCQEILLVCFLVLSFLLPKSAQDSFTATSLITSPSTVDSSNSLFSVTCTFDCFFTYLSYLGSEMMASSSNFQQHAAKFSLFLYLLVSSSSFPVFLGSKIDISPIFGTLISILSTVDPLSDPPMTLSLLTTLVTLTSDPFICHNLFFKRNKFSKLIHQYCIPNSLGTELIYTLTKLVFKCTLFVENDPTHKEIRSCFLNHFSVILCYLLANCTDIDLNVAEQLFKLFDVIYKSIEQHVCSDVVELNTQTLENFRSSQDVSPELIEEVDSCLIELLTVLLHAIGNLLFKNYRDNVNLCLTVVNNFDLLQNISNFLDIEAVDYLIFIAETLQSATDGFFDSHGEVAAFTLNKMDEIHNSIKNGVVSINSSQLFELEIDLTSHSSFFKNCLISIVSNYFPFISEE